MLLGIAAVSENRAIGLKGGIPWRNSDDFKWFKEFTLNKTILVGSNTWKNLPLLPNRKILVLTNKYNDSWYSAAKDTAMATVCWDEVTALSKTREIIVAGGAQIYNLFLPQIAEFYVTHIEGTFEADTFMPPFEHLFKFKDTVREFATGGKVVKYHNCFVGRTNPDGDV